MALWTKHLPGGHEDQRPHKTQAGMTTAYNPEHRRQRQRQGILKAAIGEV